MSQAHDGKALASTNGLLTLTQWLSPAYPVGAYTYSHGLEAAAEVGLISDGPGLEGWLGEVLHRGGGRNDALFIAAAFNADTPEAVHGVDAIARAFAASRERLLETDAQGAAFGVVTATLWGGALQGLTYPVALGAAAAQEGLALALTQQMYLQAFLSNLVAAGQRLLPVGQTEGQAILQRLSADIPAIADETALGDLDDLSATAFMSDVTAMRHETQRSRIFRT